MTDHNPFEHINGSELFLATRPYLVYIYLSLSLCVTFEDRQHHFVGYSYWQRLATVEQNRALHCPVDPALCTQQYFTPQTNPKECKTGKINPASNLFGALAVFEGRWDDLALLTRHHYGYLSSIDIEHQKAAVWCSTPSQKVEV